MRPGILLGFWRLHKGRRHVLRVLMPVAEQAGRRMAVDWGEPLAIGFLIALVTRLAQRATGALPPDALGALQDDLWVDLTGRPAGLVGEQVVLLSAANDARFAEGCRRALLFERMLIDGISDDAGEAADLAPGDVGERLASAATQDALVEFWTRCLAESA